MSWYVKSSSSSEEVQKAVSEVVSWIKKLYHSPSFKEAYQKVVAKQIKMNPGDKLLKTEVGNFNGLKIFLVDGNEVKTKFDMNFVEGGNGFAYEDDKENHQKEEIPLDEVWLDSEQRIEFLPYILSHELVEINMMTEHGMDYDHAHDIANSVEKQLREKKSYE